MWKQSASEDLRALTYSHDGRTLFTVEANRVLTWEIQAKKSTPLFQLNNPQCVVTKADVTAHGLIDNMYFSPDGKSVVLLLRHGIELWNAADMSVRVPRLPAPDAGWSFAFHPKASYFAAPNADKDLTLYDLDTGKPVRDFHF